MTELFEETNKRDVNVDLINFAENYSIKNYNFRKLGIDMNLLKSQMRQEEKERKKKIDSVYSDDNKNNESNEDDDDDEDDDKYQDSFEKRKSSLRKTKNSQIRKSQTSNLDNKKSSKKIQDDEYE